MLDLVIRNGEVYDGTGAKPKKQDIGIKDGKISRIGDLSGVPSKNVIDAAGCIITPGFIDMHSHADCSVPMWPDMENLLGQGITSCFAGHCGFGLVPVERYWLEMDFEQAAFNRIMPENVGGPCPDPVRVIPTDKLAPVFEETYGCRLDWRDYESFVKHLRTTGIGCNMSINIGHHQLRQEVMGLDFNREATEKEIGQMVKLLDKAMESGAWGLSIGLDYKPGTYALQNELLPLMQVVAKYGGVVTAHVQMRSRRGDTENPEHHTIDGYREFLELGKIAGVHVHISHMMNGHMGKMTKENERQYALETLELIRGYQNQGCLVTWDILSPSTIAMFHFPQLINLMRPYVDYCGGSHAFSRALRESNYSKLICEEILQGHHPSKSPFSRIDPVNNPKWADTIRIESCRNKEYEGKLLCELAEKWNVDPVNMVIQILQEDPETLYSKSKTFDEETFHIFECQDDASFGTDNGCINYGVFYQEKEDFPWCASTPSAFCGMIRLIEESHLPRLEDLIHRMTQVAARSAGFTDRGSIETGKAADILVLDPKRLKSNFNEIAPQTSPSGIDYVIVNGVIAVDHGVHTHRRSGQVFTRTINHTLKIQGSL